MQLLAEHGGDVSGFLGGDLRLVVLHRGGVGGFTLISGSLGGLAGGNHGSNVSIGLRLGLLCGAHDGGGVSGFLGGDLRLVVLSRPSLRASALISGSLGGLTGGYYGGDFGVGFRLGRFAGSDYGKAFRIGFGLCLLRGSLHCSGVGGLFGGYLCLIGFDGGNVVTVGIGKRRDGKSRDHAHGKQEREQFFHNRYLLIDGAPFRSFYDLIITKQMKMCNRNVHAVQKTFTQ